MKINIYGMGYVGCVSAACWANSGHDVTGIDVDDLKVRMINEGKSPIVEPGLPEAIQQAVTSRKLRATTKTGGPADISIICVGTPSHENGSLWLDNVLRASEQIGDYLRRCASYHVVNIRSTVLPGTIEDKIIPVLEERSGKKAGADFGMCMNPEFMREGASIADFRSPIFTLIGELDCKSGEVAAQMYADLSAPLIRTKIKVAEMIKYACNSFHALKVTFANEIGNICKRLGIDSHEVMDIFCQDKELNLSPFYLKPGFAFGGSCLPKDLRALLHKATQLDLESPLLHSILVSNRKQVDIAVGMIRKTGKKRVGVIGLSFKPGTDDLRESPMVELIETLLGKGYEISIYDKEVSFAKIFGSNKKFIEQVIPHISSLLKASVQEVVDGADVIVVGKKSDEFNEMLARTGKKKIIVDLVRVFSRPADMNHGNYEGICW